MGTGFSSRVGASGVIITTKATLNAALKVAFVWGGSKTLFTKP